MLTVVCWAISFIAVLECIRNEHFYLILPVYYRRHPSIAKSVELLTATCVSIVSKLTRFLYNGSVAVSPTFALFLFTHPHKFIIRPVVILMERCGLKWHVTLALVVVLYAQRRSVYC